MTRLLFSRSIPAILLALVLSARLANGAPQYVVYPANPITYGAPQVVQEYHQWVQVYEPAAPQLVQVQVSHPAPITIEPVESYPIYSERSEGAKERRSVVAIPPGCPTGEMWSIKGRCVMIFP